MTTEPTTTQKAACIKAERCSNFISTPRRVTAEALVRRGYAVWHNEPVGIIRLTLAGVRLARFGTILEPVKPRKPKPRWHGDLAAFDDI